MTFWLTRDDNYADKDYQLFHYRDHPRPYKGSYCSTAKKGSRIRWKRYSTSDWERHTGIRVAPGERIKIQIAEV